MKCFPKSHLHHAYVTTNTKLQVVRKNLSFSWLAAVATLLRTIGMKDKSGEEDRNTRVLLLLDDCWTIYVWMVVWGAEQQLLASSFY